MNLTGAGSIYLTHCTVAAAPQFGMTINLANTVIIQDSQFTNYGMLSTQGDAEMSYKVSEAAAEGKGLKVSATNLRIEGSSFYNSPNLLLLDGLQEQENMNVVIQDCTAIYCGPIVFESHGINNTISATISEMTFISAVGSVMNITEGVWDLTVENVEVQTSYGSSFVFLGPDITATIADCFFFHITSTSVEGAAIFAQGNHSLTVTGSEFS